MWGGGEDLKLQMRGGEAETTMPASAQEADDAFMEATVLWILGPGSVFLSSGRLSIKPRIFR